MAAYSVRTRVGYGDDIMASGMAREIRLRGKRAAFGNGHKIIWGPWSEEVFRHNTGIARPGNENADDIEWVDYYKGHRNYNRATAARWVWNYDFRPTPGEIFFSGDEEEFSERIGRDFVVIEPNVPWHKSVAVNKDWGLLKYQAVADRLKRAGHDVVQFTHGRNRLNGVRIVATPTIRHALAALRSSRFAVLPEGGLHHGAAAVGTSAVVLFGGFIPPEVTGYAMHVNLTGGAKACGSLQKCQHCRDALDKITVEEVCSHVA